MNIEDRVKKLEADTAGLVVLVELLFDEIIALFPILPDSIQANIQKLVEDAKHKNFGEVIGDK